MSQAIGLLLRHGLTAVGLQEVLGPDDTTRLAGALMVLAGIAWSVWQKQGLRAKLLRFLD